jgi:hypothetical protein
MTRQPTTGIPALACRALPKIKIPSNMYEPGGALCLVRFAPRAGADANPLLPWRATTARFLFPVTRIPTDRRFIQASDRGPSHVVRRENNAAAGRVRAMMSLDRLILIVSLSLFAVSAALVLVKLTVVS